MEETRMSRRNILDLAASLAEKHGLSADDATQFINQIFDVLSDGLQSDKQVKIKGLGTFKVTTINSRESVDVNTGERILINERDRISFTPDTSMRDLVNRPFSQFETVPLRDDVEFTEPEAQAEPIETTSHQETPIPNQLSKSELTLLDTASELVIPEPDTEEAAPVIIEQPQPVIEEPIPVTTPEPTTEIIENTPEPDRQIDELTSQLRRCHRLIYTLVACLFVLVIGGATTIFYVINQVNESCQPSIVAPSTPKAVSHRPAPKVVVSPPSAPSQRIQKPTPQPEQPQPEPEDPMLVQYNRDIRIRTGAYRITGIATTVKARSGQTLSEISRTHLGPGMDCYIEAVNPGVTNLQMGQKINIPKLERKRKRSLSPR
ncbi:MAG: HU family DNA-binding protein [Hoylesella enoeca]|uniref:HU family DNA-binding protein n=1 Tax=Hoylesella enoeca TaxID=76123 RepID=UPI003FA1657F